MHRRLIIATTLLACTATAQTVPTMAPYLVTHRRSAHEMVVASDFLASAMRPEGTGLDIDGVSFINGIAGGEAFSLRVNADLEVTTAVPRDNGFGDFGALCPRYDPTGEYPYVVVSCADIATDTAGTAFFVDPTSDHRISVATDGRFHYTPLGYDARIGGVASIALETGGALFAVASTDSVLHLFALDAQGRARWHQVAGTHGEFGTLAWTKQGTRVLLLRQQERDLSIDLIDPTTGAQTPYQQHELGANAILGSASLDSEGNVFLWLDSEIGGGPQSLQRFNAVGALTHSQGVHCHRDEADVIRFDFVAGRCGLSSRGTQTHWFSIDDEGARLFKVDGGAAPREVWGTPGEISAMALTHAGDSLISLAMIDGNYRRHPHFVRVGADASVDDPIELASLPAVPLRASIASDGAGGQVIAERAEQDIHSLRRFDRFGTLQWKVALAPGHNTGNISSTQICAMSSGFYGYDSEARALVDCFSLIDGAPTLSAQTADLDIASAVFAAHAPGRALGFARQRSSGDGLLRLVEWRQGAAARILADDLVNPKALLDRQDRVWAIERDTTPGPMQLRRWDASGTELPAHDLPTAVVALQDAVLDDQDRLWIIYNDADVGTYRLARIDAEGRFADATQTVVPGRHIAHASTHGADTLVQVDRYEGPYFDGASASTLLSLSAAGEPKWQYFARSDWPHFAAVDIDTARIDVLEVALWPEAGWRISELDPATGTVRANRKLPLPHSGTRVIPSAASLTGQRIDYVLDDGTTYAFGSAGFAPGVVVRDIASALDGAWSIPGLGGQGLVFEYNPAVGLLSAAWYSHDTAYPEFFEHSALHWHTLLGVVPGHETFEMPMSIFENAGGAFDDLPTTASTQVGSATLSVTGCDQMTLSYTFGNDQPTARTIALQRASPRTLPCTLRLPNSTQTNTTPASYTPQSDLGGSWYEQRTSGQGVNLVVYPPSTASAPETIGLGWFTYDPAGAADESTQQHWFTASGRFDTVEQQRANLTIYRTTGGDRTTTSTRNTHRVGEATLERIDCDSATLTYRFDDTLVAGTFAAKTRTIPLQRLGGCRP